MDEYLPWLSLALLGAFHGLNPGMGWLFAVALGLQERRRTAVIRALGPIAAGHFASIALVVVVVSLVQAVATPDLLRCGAAATLVAFGVMKLTPFGAHPRWVGMRVTCQQLAVWSFLMATAHGAGLMLAPVILHLLEGEAAMAAHAAPGSGHDGHRASLMGSDRLPLFDLPGPELLAVTVHTAAMLLVMGGVAVLVFEWLGLAILRRAWINLDRVWAGSLVAVGLLTLAV